MRKIMFNEKYGLTQAVLEGRKTMTRRVIIQIQDGDQVGVWPAPYIELWRNGQKHDIFPTYQVGEVVAVSQSYVDIYHGIPDFGRKIDFKRQIEDLYGMSWADVPATFNKMFVRADLMPHRIRITNIKAERLQDISKEEILREGIMEGEFMNTWDRYYYDMCGDVPNHITFKTPRLAFHSLIDKLSGRGTWESNHWVWAYEFELVK